MEVEVIPADRLDLAGAVELIELVNRVQTQPPYSYGADEIPAAHVWFDNLQSRPPLLLPS